MIANEQKLEGLRQITIYTVNAADAFFKSITTVTSAFRTMSDQERIYKEQFGVDYKKYMPTNSAHTQGLAVDISIKNVDPAKIYVWGLDSCGKYNIWGMGLDMFKGYVHLDNFDRGTGKITRWVYDSNGVIHYL